MDRAIFPYTVENGLKERFFDGKRAGFFVDVGANDPEDGSQTLHLERLGWNGVLIEPQPELAAKLKACRRAKVFACACSSPQNAGRSMSLRLSGIHSSLNPDFFVAGASKGDVIEVPVRTLDDILEEAKAPVPLDLVTIDVESHEIDVLRGFTLSRWRPRLIFIEDLVLDLRLHRVLVAAGYKWVRRTGINSWYVPGETPMRLGAYGRWQFLRKYYLARPLRRLRDAKRKLRERVKQVA